MDRRIVAIKGFAADVNSLKADRETQSVALTLRQLGWTVIVGDDDPEPDPERARKRNRHWFGDWLTRNWS